MNQFYFHIITSAYTPAIVSQIKKDITHQLKNIGIRNVSFLSFEPYQKLSNQGKLICTFSASIPLVSIQSSFADCWHDDTADIRWSKLRIPNTTFLWLFH